MSLGASPLDALLAFIEAHAADMGELKQLATDIKSMAGLLLATDDSYDSQVKAQDLLYGNNYANSDGGNEWHFDGRAAPGETPPAPDWTHYQALADLNARQSKLNSTNKALAQARWDLFALWWNLVSDINNKSLDKEAEYRTRVQQKYNEVDALDKQAKDLQQYLQNPAKTTGYKLASKEPFFQRKDPTA